MHVVHKDYTPVVGGGAIMHHFAHRDIVVALVVDYLHLQVFHLSLDAVGGF